MDYKLGLAGLVAIIIVVLSAKKFKALIEKASEPPAITDGPVIIDGPVTS